MLYLKITLKICQKNFHKHCLQLISQLDVYCQRPFDIHIVHTQSNSTFKHITQFNQIHVRGLSNTSTSSFSNQLVTIRAVHVRAL